MKHTRNVNRKSDLLDLKEILKSFEDSATIHGTNIGVGDDVMSKYDQFWALLRTKFVVLNNLDVDNIDVITYPKKQGRIDFDREYIIKNNNEVLIEGISKWVIVSKSTRTLKRNHNILIENCIEESLFDSVSKIDFDFSNFKLIDTYSVTKEDIDKNNHFNNTNYANVIKKVYNTFNIKEFQIDYLHEVLVNNTISIYKYVSEYTYILGRCNEENCFIAKIKEN